MPSTADSWPRDALPQGTHLYGYRIDGVLGRGGFGITYRALDRIEQQFAIKECFPRQFAVRQGSEVFPTDAAAAESLAECLDRFTREAKGLLRLSRLGAAGDGVVKVNTSFETNGTAYIVMELVTGGSFENLIKASPAGVAEEQLTAILPALLHAVGCAHDAGLLHRDIKPSNILLREDGRPVLIDFGAVRGLGAGQAHTYTQVFSEGYAPIEQITGAPQGPYSDIYSVGASFYRAIGGRTVDALSRHVALAAGKPDPLVPAVRIGASRYHEPLLKAIDAALHVAAEDRPQTVRDFLALTDASCASDTVTLVRSPPPDATETRRRGPTLPPVDVPVEEAERKPRAGRTSRGGEAGAGQRSKPWTAARIAIAFGPLAVVAGLAFAGLEYRRETAAPPASKPTALGLPSTAAKPAAGPEPGLSAAQALARGRDALRRKHYAEAMRWYRKAADQGNADAQLDIGSMYATGWGGARHDAEAMRWYRNAMRSYRKAAEQGDANAQFKIGLMYANGLGVARDYAEALHWYHKAADQGDSEAQVVIAEMYEYGQGVARDEAQAARWYRKAADLGDATAQTRIGYMYASGSGVERDYAEAMRWYRKAADQGDPEAQRRIGVMYERGWGVPRDLKQAREWMEKAAAGGNEVARDWMVAHKN